MCDVNVCSKERDRQTGREKFYRNKQSGTESQECYFRWAPYQEIPLWDVTTEYKPEWYQGNAPGGRASRVEETQIEKGQKWKAAALVWAGVLKVWSLN